jgi:CBS-domain-containing membrane protein
MSEQIPTARELMTQEFLAVRPTLGLLDAVAVLEDAPEDTAFVIDEHDRLLGILSEKECLRALAARAYDEAIAETVKDVMCASPATLTPSTDVYTIAQAFLSCSCGMLPIMDGPRVAGAISQLSMLRVFLAVFRKRTEERGEIEQSARDLRGRPESQERMQRVAANLDREQLASLFSRNVRHRK